MHEKDKTAWRGVSYFFFFSEGERGTRGRHHHHHHHHHRLRIISPADDPYAVPQGASPRAHLGNLFSTDPDRQIERDRQTKRNKVSGVFLFRQEEAG